MFQYSLLSYCGVPFGLAVSVVVAAGAVFSCAGVEVAETAVCVCCGEDFFCAAGADGGLTGAESLGDASSSGRGSVRRMPLPICALR